MPAETKGQDKNLTTTFARDERLRTQLATVLELCRGPLRVMTPFVDLLVRAALAKAFFAPGMLPGIGADAVSYTHLTLPTILLV